jgi:hypothetical protein
MCGIFWAEVSDWIARYSIRPLRQTMRSADKRKTELQTDDKKAVDAARAAEPVVCIFTHSLVEDALRDEGTINV